MRSRSLTLSVGSGRYESSGRSAKSYSPAGLEVSRRASNAITVCSTSVATDAGFGNNAVARHLWVSESELDGKTTNIDIGILEVWVKDGDWKLLARQGFSLPA